MSTYGRRFWVSTAERALKTLGQTGATDLTMRGIGSAALTQRYPVPWWASVGGVGLSTVYSVLSSIGSAKIGPDDSPSLVGEPPKVDTSWHDDQVEHAKLIEDIDRGRPE